VIRSNAAVDDIFADVQTARDNAVATGGVARSLAEARLGPVLAIGSTPLQDLSYGYDDRLNLIRRTDYRARPRAHAGPDVRCTTRLGRVLTPDSIVAPQSSG
jgi:hypothetical protein